MEIVIGIVLIIAVLFVIGVYAKKKYYAEIDRLEQWKVDVMNRPVLDEVGKIKQLNMSGQAEEYFEQWRKTWDGVVTVDLPNVEELLYDAEDHVSKFRFSKVKQVFNKIESTLAEAEDKINKMVDRLNEVLKSEEKNRQDILDIQDLYKEMKKKLVTHRHTYGESVIRLEAKLGAAYDQLEVIFEETNNGNYLTAREMIIRLLDELKQLHVSVEKIPLLLNECQNQLPSQIQTLKDGIKDMQESGFYLDHIGCDSEIEKMEKSLTQFIEMIQNGEITGVEEGIDEIKGSLELIYDLLENEVSSKQFFKENEAIVQNTITTIFNKNIELKKEIDEVKDTYHLLDKDLTVINEISKRIEQIKKTIHFIVTEGEKNLSAFTAIKEKLERIIHETVEIEQKQLQFAEMLQALRKDEVEAHEKLKFLKNLMKDTNRIIIRSNIPGVPSQIEDKFDEAISLLNESFLLLEQKPLEMENVKQAIEKAETEIQNLNQEVVEMVENVYFIEKIIQYGNRYRRSHPSINEGLNKAELAFRQLDYKLALEEAASAVEAVEPGALKRIEEIINEEQLVQI